MLNTIKTITAVFILSCCFMVGCKKDYFVDTGVHKAQYNGTILEYLKAKPIIFDSLTRVIKVAGMEDVFQKENVTFFAPPSSCIYKAVKNLNRYLRTTGKDTVSQLEQVKPQVWKEMLSLYVFKGSYLLKDVPQLDTLAINAFGGQGYTSLGGRPMNIGVFYNDASGVKYVGYRQLILSYIPDFSTPKIGLINTPIASSDIQPTNGVIHALVYQNHSFGFGTDRFIIAAISAGIGKAGE
ncbi:fasciclin domain-containing protein [Pedobacter gandavensis]|uniref:fasciclin domain-containing protein n=1 Tax=Pedobacter gandavensis TaxID=2679963 RepID=UPI00292F54AA|nr:fasciclin domain-containing protein [Pedobacter gandavensis]